ncbi:MAG: NACHT domain-containing protein [Chloroflexota bacterium]|nr:NACHT domain-containing protein [Chloroflexota bacterium]
MHTPNKVDVLLVTVTDVETDAVLRIFRERISQHVTQQLFIGGKTYHDLGRIGRARTFLVQSEMGSGVRGGSLQTVEAGIQALQPGTVVMVGIAFGLRPEEQQIGDILVSQQLLDYESQRVGTRPDGRIETRIRGDCVSASTRLRNQFRNAYLDWQQREQISVHFGLVVSLGKVIDYQEHRDQLREHVPEALGGEMEGAGLYAAAHDAKVDWIIVKAIADWADGTKSHSKQAYQCLAAENAAAFTFHVLQCGQFDHSFPERQNTNDFLRPLLHRFSFRSPAEILAGRGSNGSEQHLRRVLLKRVRREWIDNYLRQSLHCDALITLRLHVHDDLTWQFAGLVNYPRHVPHPFVSSTEISQVFDDRDGSLIILGAAGCGKTITMLTLARDLLDRADNDPRYVLPVVFHLSSWSARRKPLADWLVDELLERYNVPRQTSRMWIEQGRLLPLLDGLDEVTAVHRTECVTAINTFTSAHVSAGLVVCCRLEAYQALPVKLRLGGAITIQPLTHQQVDKYLRDLKRPGAGVRAAFHDDPILGQLVETPLILNIVTLTYHGMSAASLRASGDLEERRIKIVAAYIDQMLQRKPTATRYPQEAIRHWLAWLARTMQEHSQSILYLERMQPTWLPHSMQRWYYTLMAIILGLLVGLFMSPGTGIHFGILLGAATTFGLLIGGVNQLMCTSSWLPRTSLYIGALIGLCLGTSIGILVYQSSFPELRAATFHIAAVTGLTGCFSFVAVHRLCARLSEGWQAGVSVGMSVGTGVGLFVGLLDWMTRAPTNIIISEALIACLAVGLLSGLVSGLLAQLSREIRIVETLHWSWKRAAQAAALAGLSVGLMTSIGVSWETGLLWGLRFGVLCGLIVGLAGGEIEERNTPNQGIWRSFGNLFWGVVAGFVVWLAFGVFPSESETIQVRVPTAVRAALIVGLLWGLRGGLVACCQHVVLRLLLYRNGSIPLNYVRFLDYAADHMLLRKIGGGYTFVHHQIREFFAVQQLTSGHDSPSIPTKSPRDLPN